MRKLLVLVMFGALALTPALATTANASMLQIICGGLDLVYDGSAIYDANSPSGGLGNPAEADALDSMVFRLFDGGPPTTLGTLTSNIFADIYIGGVENLPLAGGLVQSTGTGFGFDLLVKNSIPGWGLGLNLEGPLDITYDGQAVNVLGSGQTSSITAQDLPFGIGIGTPVQISFSANIFNHEDNGDYLTYFEASGSGEVTGPAVPEIPEPGTLLLLGMGLLGGGATAARRRLRK